MSDQVLYLLMTGVNAVQDRMTATTNNLANANTTAYKAQRPVFTAAPYYHQGQPDRVGVSARDQGADFKAGAVAQTGRSLDVAIKGEGWIGVQAKDGTPAYTRNGALFISPTGVLQTNDGHPVLGQSATPISLPALQSVTIGEDGTVSGIVAGADPTKITSFDRIMLAKPPAAAMQRRADGLFSDTSGGIQIDGQVSLQPNALEQSNVDSVGMMMNLIENTRMFQMQTGMMRTMSNIGQGAQSPLSLQ